MFTLNKNVTYNIYALLFTIALCMPWSVLNSTSDASGLSESKLVLPRQQTYSLIGTMVQRYTSGEPLLNLLQYISLKHAMEQDPLVDDDPYEGYTLFGPEYSQYTYLLNMNGRIVHTWKSNYIQGLSTHLLENGNLLRLDLPGDNPTFRAGGIAGRVELFNEQSTLLWAFEYSNENHCLHHDLEPLPNGNILLVAWEYKTREEALNSGRNPDRLRSDALWPDHILEIKPVGFSEGEIVWEWHVWDHLIQDFDSTKNNYGVVEDHPELIDVNYGTRDADWNHINAIDYNVQLDQILLSVHNFNEIWVIDHSTTTEEAAGHTGGNSGKGGDLLYRWGNPVAYGTGTVNDQKFFGQHGANWIESGCPGAGNILVFNNGNEKRRYSTVDEIIPPIDDQGTYQKIDGKAYGPEHQTWVYVSSNPTDLYSMMLSSAQRLTNGNTLICSANQGLFIEVTPKGHIVWQYLNILPSPMHNAVARVQRYPLDYPGIPEVERTNQDGTQTDIGNICWTFITRSFSTLNP